MVESLLRSILRGALVPLLSLGSLAATPVAVVAQSAEVSPLAAPLIVAARVGDTNRLNALIAGGANHEFYPVFSFADVESFSFIIMNRWGQIVWEAEDITDRWDGKVNGAYVPQGIYVYSFSYSRGDGKRREVLGHVTFINLLE